VGRRSIVWFVIAAGGLVLAPGGAHAVSTGACRDLVVGPPEVIVSDARRDALGLTGWPDGTLGILPRGDGTYSFWAADAFGGAGPRSQRNILSVGTLDDPLAGGVKSATQVANVPPQYTWAGGAPVYRDPASGIVLQTLHLERQSTVHPGSFWSVLALGSVDPNTGQTTFLGEIISPELPYETSSANGWTADFGMPSFTIAHHGGVPWFHFYFADFREASPGVFAADGLSVAGAPVAEVIDAARRGTVSPWRKLYQGVWSEPALGGRSDDIQAGSSQAWAPRVLHSRELAAYFMVAPTGPREVVLSTSPDGIGGWSPRVSLFSDPSFYNAYVTLAGRGGDPSDLGHSFYLYYTQWPSLEPNWQNARLLRRAIECAPAPPTPGPAPPAARSKPRALRLRRVSVTWKRHRLALRARGRLVPPRGMKRACAGGKVRIRLHVRKRVLTTRRTVRRDCTVGVRQRWRVRRRPRRPVTVRAKFLGNAALAPLASKPRRVKVGTR
jgi:hypothetical protein